MIPTKLEFLLTDGKNLTKADIAGIKQDALKALDELEMSDKPEPDPTFTLRAMPNKLLLKKVFRKVDRTGGTIGIITSIENAKQETIMWKVLAAPADGGLVAGDHVIATFGFEPFTFEGYEMWVGKVDNVIAKVVKSATLDEINKPTPIKEEGKKETV